MFPDSTLSSINSKFVSEARSMLLYNVNSVMSDNIGKWNYHLQTEAAKMKPYFEINNSGVQFDYELRTFKET